MSGKGFASAEARGGGGGGPPPPPRPPPLGGNAKKEKTEQIYISKSVLGGGV